MVCESDNFTGSSVPLIESLKSKVHLITDARKRKNLTHLQRILLFKDSSGPCSLRSTQDVAIPQLFGCGYAALGSMQARLARVSSRPEKIRKKQDDHESASRFKLLEEPR